MSELFEDENDAVLGLKLLVNLNQKVFDVISTIRNHIAIDDLTQETRMLLSKRPQLKFIDKEEMDDLMKK